MICFSLLHIEESIFILYFLFMVFSSILLVRVWGVSVGVSMSSPFQWCHMYFLLCFVFIIKYLKQIFQGSYVENISPYLGAHYNLSSSLSLQFLNITVCLIEIIFFLIKCCSTLFSAGTESNPMGILPLIPVGFGPGPKWYKYFFNVVNSKDFFHMLRVLYTMISSARQSYLEDELLAPG